MGKKIKLVCGVPGRFNVYFKGFEPSDQRIKRRRCRKHKQESSKSGLLRLLLPEDSDMTVEQAILEVTTEDEEFFWQFDQGFSNFQGDWTLSRRFGLNIGLLIVSNFSFQLDLNPLVSH